MTTTSPATASTTLPFTGRAALAAWVAEAAEVLQPDRIEWFAGGAEALAALTDGMVDRGELIRLDPAIRPNSFLARSSEDDVARVEDRTFICSERREDGGPTNNWRDPQAMRAELAERFAGAMRGRTMHVVPFSMGPLGGPISQVGVQITDSPYVVASTAIMTRAGLDVLDVIGDDTAWVPAMHTLGVPLEPGAADVAWPSNPVKIIAHFPETREIVSFGSGYGGNALLAKKCFALRIASVMARDGGWLAEHMLLVRVTTPEGRAYHLAGAFPSACGKTNLAMLQSTLPGWRIETLGDDIVWIRPGQDGRLMAMNPEAGFFGVAPGTGPGTNPVALATMAADTIFTNVALSPDGDVWWEGLSDVPPAGLVDWRGEPWSPGSGRPAAHPNARFTVPIEACPTLADGWDAQEGVPLDAIVFGGRRATAVPLVAQADDWAHGVFFGATVASERTAAAEGRVGELRFDPFAMLPFCGYDMADYFAHWLDVGAASGEHAPPVFRVNWFRKDDDGRFLWPGFGENVRVLEWIVRRLEGRAAAVPTAAGRVPAPGGLDLAGAEIDPADLARALAVDPAEWRRECDAIEMLFDRFEDRVPPALRQRLAITRAGLGRPEGEPSGTPAGHRGPPR